MKIGIATAEETAQISRALTAYVRTLTTEPATAYGALLAAGVELATADLGEPRTLALAVHIFGPMVDMGRVLIGTGAVDAFNDPPAGHAA